MIRLLLPLLLVALGACSLPVPIQPGPDFYVMRHLNTKPGTPDPELNAEGQAEAQRLADFFANRRPPAIILVTDTRRARQTAAPLAARLGLEPVVYDPRDTYGLVDLVTKSPNPALIVGHSNTVPEIVAALGGARPEPIPDTQFGDIWHVSGPRRTVMRYRVEQP
jgi:phosphohistidine phosphatase SixA